MACVLDMCVCCCGMETDGLTITRVDVYVCDFSASADTVCTLRLTDARSVSLGVH
jgi:hypothetical protein